MSFFNEFDKEMFNVFDKKMKINIPSNGIINNQLNNFKIF